jgi:ABC-type multidrug transport system ATPase subunit
VSINGHNLDREPEAALRQVTTLIQGTSPLNPGQSLLENLHPAEEQCERLLRSLRLWEHRDEAVGALSHGFQRRATLSYVLLAPARIVLLDEPMLGLDENVVDSLRKHIRKLVEREEKTIIVATCHPRWVRAFCDRAVVLREGQVIGDIPISRRLGLTQEAIYKIKVKGVLDTRWANWFDGLTVTPLSDETILCGPIADQPALHSVLVKIRDLGLPLVSLHYIDPTLEPLQD